MNNKKPFISVVFPNFNGGDFVLKCVKSLLNQNYPKESFEIIIVDNGSSDGSRENLYKEFKESIDNNRVRIIETGENIGAPKAYNIGIKASNEGYKYILKMDNDLVLDKDCLDEMVKCGESDSGYGVVGGKVYFYWDKNRIHAVGSKIRAYYTGGRAVGGNEIDNGQFDKNKEFDAINGCMMLVKREAIEKVGLMDEDYFIYFDDHDWSLRITKAGFRHIYCYSAKSWHNTKPDVRFKSPFWLYYAVRNSFYFMEKNYSGINKLMFFVFINLNFVRFTLNMFLNAKVKDYSKLITALKSSYLDGLKYVLSH